MEGSKRCGLLGCGRIWSIPRPVMTSPHRNRVTARSAPWDIVLDFAPPEARQAARKRQDLRAARVAGAAEKSPPIHSHRLSAPRAAQAVDAAPKATVQAGAGTALLRELASAAQTVGRAGVTSR